MSLSNALPRSLLRSLFAALCCAAVVAPRQPAHAGHEVSYYPSFYPQEIRIEPLEPEQAASELANTTNPLHAYIGGAPRFAGEPPGHVKTVVSLDSIVTVTVDAKSPRFQTREARCREIERVMAAAISHTHAIAHRYPITPYHADYLGHVDRVPDVKPPSAPTANFPFLKIRSGVAAIEPPHSSDARLDASEQDVSLDEISVIDLLRKARAGFHAWPAPRAKEGWFQAYHLLRPALSATADRERADEIFARLAHGEFRDSAEQINLQRELVAALTHGCERAVVGYVVRREFYNDDFSNGIENILVDSQFGFNSPVFIRTVKLKDFPWNGWLRIGIGARMTAAWNPVAGFTDAAGRLVWATAGDDAFLAIPHNSRWIQNRVDVRTDDDAKPNQSVRVPADALMAEPGTGRLAAVGSGQGAIAKVSYRVLASSFHDGSEMEPADLLYPYAFAFRWGAGAANGAFDPEIAAATRPMRERLKGVRIIRVEESTLQLADLAFTYRSPIVEVYLDNLASDEQESTLLAPPWSSVPWHVLALMEAAVEHGIGAFSQSEAERRGLPWLDLVRDPAQRAKMAALIEEFAKAGYRPSALASLVTPEAATARWEMLHKFVEAHGHLLVTNGPYRLASWSPDAFVFNVVREFSYPVGIGTFDAFAYPPRALITAIELAGNRILVAADAETAVKQQRDRRIVRTALTRDTLRGTLPMQPVSRYVIVGENGKVVAAGTAKWESDGRFAVSPPTLPPGAYSFLTAVFLDGNAITPTIGRIDFRSE